MQNYQNIENQQEYEVLLNNLKAIEAQIMPKLEQLGEKIPEIYYGYADVVRITVNDALKILNMKESTSEKFQLAAEIGARTLEAYGVWKAAKEHNKMLDKVLMAKRTYAELNLSQIEKALAESDKNLIKVKKMFFTYSNIQYDLTNANLETIMRLSNILLRQLVLYRTNLFISKICRYLKAECRAWSQGIQTSDVPQTDYYIVNQEILRNLFSTNFFNALEIAGDSQGSLTGSQIMLLSDPQLAVYALKDTLAQINFDDASYAVRVLTYNNPGFSYYINQTVPLVKEIKNEAINNIYVIALIALIVVVCMCIWFIPGAWWGRLIIGIIASAAIIKITSKNYLKLKVMHVTQTMGNIAVVDDVIESYCGKVETQDIDYTRKDALTSALQTFFN